MSEAEIRRGPGRPPRSEEVKVVRRRRQGTGAERNMKLHVPEDMKDKEFVYRWANDTPGRIKQLTEADDYEVVSMDAPDQLTAASEGTVMRRTVDKESGGNAVLLRKPKEFYESDRIETEKLRDERDEVMRKGALPSADALAGSEAYVPGGRNIVGGR